MRRRAEDLIEGELSSNNCIRQFRFVWPRRDHAVIEMEEIDGTE